MRTPGSAGAALVTAVVLTLAVTLLAHGAFVLSNLELRAARAGADVLAARFAAERGAVEALHTVAASSFATLPIGGASDTVSAGFGPRGRSGWISRLSEEIWLLEGEARVGVARLKRAVPVWVADPATRVAAIGAPVGLGISSMNDIEGVVDPAQWEHTPAVLPPDSCPPDLAGARRSTVPAVRLLPDSVVSKLGRLSLDTIASRARVTVSGVGSPAPIEQFGSCLDDPWNWGAVERLGRPCEARTVYLRAAPGTRAEHGRGQGLLVSRGDLTLSNVMFYGAILVGGTLTVERSSRLHGMVIAREGLQLSSDSRIIGSGCWAEAVLTDSGLTAPVRLPGARWVTLQPRS